MSAAGAWLVTRRIRLGLVTDPGVPEQVAETLAKRLPGMLGDQWDCVVEVEVDPIAAGQHDVTDILQVLATQTGQHEWDYAICLTDLPLRHNYRPVLAEINRADGVAVVALPSLGGAQTQRRARQLVARILDEFTAPDQAEAEQGTQAAQRGLQSRLTRLVAPIQRQQATSERGAVDIRYLGTRRRGRFRLVTGMVRTNRPWRLAFGMSSALAAAIAASAFGLSSSTIWQLAAALDPAREAVVSVLSVGALSGWLIATHRLWERASTNSSGRDRELVQLYNLSTMATLTIGVGCLYVGLFVVNLAIAVFLVPSSVLSSLIGSSDFATHLGLAWGFTTMGIIAGALGSSLESDQTVRQAAYGYREQQRRGERLQHEQPSAEAPAPDHAPADHEPPDTATTAATRTKDELYTAAQQHDIRGRSQMTKQQLADALEHTNNQPDQDGDDTDNG